MENKNEVEVVRPQDVEIIDDEKEAEGVDASGTSTGSGNGVAVNAAGSKITVGVGELNNSKGAGAQVSNVQGDINFGNVSAKPSRFDRVPPAPEAKQLDNGQEFSR